jgi:hypothetical protein
MMINTSSSDESLSTPPPSWWISELSLPPSDLTSSWDSASSESPELSWAGGLSSNSDLESESDEPEEESPLLSAEESYNKKASCRMNLVEWVKVNEESEDGIPRNRIRRNVERSQNRRNLRCNRMEAVLPSGYRAPPSL